MCLVCKDWAKGRLTKYEALRNLEEIEKTITEEHIEEVVELVLTDSTGPFDEYGEDWEHA